MQNIVTNKDRQKIRKSIQRILVLAVFVLLIVANKKVAYAEEEVSTTLTIDGRSVNPSVATSGKGSGGGTWSFTPAKGVQNATLTLNNYNGSIIDYSYAPGNLDIVLVGSNVVTNSTDESGRAINYFSLEAYTMTIKGSGRLTVNSIYKGIAYDAYYKAADQGVKLVFNATVTINSYAMGIWSDEGKLFINGGTLNILPTRGDGIIVNHLLMNAGTVTIKSTGDYACGIFMSATNSKFEANGGRIIVNTFDHAIAAYKGDLYFNEGSYVEVTNSKIQQESLNSMYGQIHFNGGEVHAYSKASSVFRCRKDANGKFVYFGDLNPSREMAFFEGNNFNSLKRVPSITLEDQRLVGLTPSDSIAIYPKWKASIGTGQKNATLKLTNKTPTFGGGPATSVSGMKGETITVSASCAKGKKIASLYYYKKSDPTKKTNISLTTKTFTMPEYDIVVAAKVTDTAKVSKIKLNKAKVTIRKGKNYTLRTSIKPSNADDKSLTWKSSNKRVATVSQSGVVTGKRYGTATITATAKDGSKKKATCKVSVGYSIDYKLNGGTNSKKNLSAYYKQTVTLKEPTRKGHVFKGWYTNKKMTKKIAAISKKSKKNYTLYAKWKKVKAPSAPKISKASNVTGSKIEVTLKTMKNIHGYQISYATNATFTENVKTTTTTKQTKTLKKLKKGITYYIRVRAYQLDSAQKKVYGTYSQVKKVEVKK